MDNNQRATVAFLCGCLHSSNLPSHTSVFDYSQNASVPCSFSNNGGQIMVFDYNRSCYLNGRYPTFYDYGVSQYITISKIGNNMYNVYDYHTSSFLSITCMGNNISVYDYALSQYFNYSLN
jgi:hypothetical protein